MKTIQNEQGLKQFLACLLSHYDLSFQFIDKITWSYKNRLSFKTEVNAWYQQLCRDVLNNEYGYAKYRVRRKPDLEDQMLGLAESASQLTVEKKHILTPGVCLTHDIDYLKPTLPFRLKQLMRKKISLSNRDYLDSVQKLLALDAEAAGRAGCSTVFIAAVKKLSGFSGLQQWIIDPSYKIDDSLFSSLLEILASFQTHVGQHGSFFSLSQELIFDEKKCLEKALGQELTLVRQHWLHLPGKEPLCKLANAGYTIDSSLGWNDGPGFRAGFSRPFPWLTGTKYLWEVPLVIMDGPLFEVDKRDECGLWTNIQAVLDDAWARGGCIAINWHDRAADHQYRWDRLYEQILNYAVKRSISFVTLEGAVRQISDAVKPQLENLCRAS